jgi:hypothetical protein
VARLGNGLTVEITIQRRGESEPLIFSWVLLVIAGLADLQYARHYRDGRAITDEIGRREALFLLLLYSACSKMPS